MSIGRVEKRSKIKLYTHTHVEEKKLIFDVSYIKSHIPFLCIILPEAFCLLHTPIKIKFNTKQTLFVLFIHMCSMRPNTCDNQNVIIFYVSNALNHKLLSQDFI